MDYRQYPEGHDYRSYKERTIIALHGEKCEVFGTIS